MTKDGGFFISFLYIICIHLHIAPILLITEVFSSALSSLGNTSIPSASATYHSSYYNKTHTFS